MSGRQQDLVKKPSQTNSREGQVEFGYDNYAPHLHESRKKQPMQYQESLSHHRSRYRDREVPGESHERREYGWHSRNGRGHQVQSRPTPLVARSEKRPNIDERVSRMNPIQVDNQKRYGYVEYEDYNDGSGRYDYADHEDYNKGGHRRQEYVEYEEYNYGHRRNEYADNEYYNIEAVRKSNHGYRHDGSVQVNKEDYGDRRFLVENEHGAMAGNLVPVEDGGHELEYEQDPRAVRVRQGRGHGQGYEQNPQPVRLRQDRGRGQGYEQDTQPVRLRQDHGQGYEQDTQPVRLRQDHGHGHGHGQGYGQSSQSYPTFEMRRYKEENEVYQEIPPEEYYMENYYKDKETCVQQSRKFSHPSSPPQHKDYNNQHFPKSAPPSTSSGPIREEFPGRLQGVDIHSIDGYTTNHEPSEILVAQEYGQRAQLEPRKDYDVVGCADMKCRQCDHYTYSWSEQEDYAHAYAESRGKNHPGYRTHDALYRQDRSHAQADSEHRYMQRVVIAKPIAENPTKAEGSHRMYRNDGLREREISSTEEIPAYEGPGRPIGTLTQEADCLNPIYVPAEFARRASQELQLNEASILPDNDISGYDKGRYVSAAKTQGERVKSSAEFLDPEDVQRLDERQNRYSDEQVANRMVKRKYLQGEEARELSLGTKASHKWSSYNSSQQIEDCRPDWNNRSSGALHSQVPSGREPNLFMEAKDMINETSHHKGTERYSWSDQGKSENRYEQSVKSYEPERKYMKVHPKSEYSKGYSRSHYNNHRNERYKQNYKRGENENRMDVARDHNFSEDPKGPLNYDTCEDSEAFKQSVLAAFLMYSKKLNDNPPIRRLYKHQGNSGTLFCIVCGRSTSKVFRDTEGLTRHSFMARKATLRAQHLGLHRAICVLMGWSPDVPPEEETWMPRSLPKPEAMAQKEDLIIWQPTVIVHNISLSNNNHQEWKAISLEALESIIRAKSFIRSKIKICLGHPGDQSVMLVKFLGTFTGLQEAEKLHNYFADNNRGRAAFEQAITEMNSKNREQQTVEEEESLLYGYTGIAEDLDRIDLDTKKRCKIQSKREIQVLVDAPLKREWTTFLRPLCHPITIHSFYHISTSQVQAQMCRVLQSSSSFTSIYDSGLAEGASGRVFELMIHRFEKSICWTRIPRARPEKKSSPISRPKGEAQLNNLEWIRGRVIKAESELRFMDF
ncbi:hypothetical protein V2J09_013574 [Rumex salicifolius]